MRVKHCRMKDMLAIFLGQCRDCQFLHIDVGFHHGGKLRRHRADVGSLNAVGVDHAGQFDDAVIGKIADRAIVGDIAINAGRAVGHHGVHDDRRIFV